MQLADFSLLNRSQGDIKKSRLIATLALQDGLEPTTP